MYRNQVIFVKYLLFVENWEQVVEHMACYMFLKTAVSFIYAEKVKVGLGYKKTYSD